MDQYVTRRAFLIHRSWMMTFARNMALDNSSLYAWDGGGDWEGGSQECSALSFLMCKGLKRIPNAFKKKDNGRKEEQYALVNKGKQ